jgi:hypothetical protein
MHRKWNVPHKIFFCFNFTIPVSYWVGIGCGQTKSLLIILLLSYFNTTYHWKTVKNCDNVLFYLRRIINDSDNSKETNKAQNIVTKHQWVTEICSKNSGQKISSHLCKTFLKNGLASNVCSAIMIYTTWQTATETAIIRTSPFLHCCYH